MSSDQYFKQKFADLVCLEEKARDLYKFNIDRVQDPKLLATFREIHSDEIRHVQIAKRLLEIVSK